MVNKLKKDWLTRNGPGKNYKFLMYNEADIWLIDPNWSDNYFNYLPPEYFVSLY